jgi:hypothetical protein
MSWRVEAKYRPNRIGIGMCALGPELTAATRVIAYKAKSHAQSISPYYIHDSHKGLHYKYSFEVDEFIETEVGYPHPWPRVGHYLATTAPHAIIVEFGQYWTPAYRVFRKTLQHLEKTRAEL